MKFSIGQWEFTLTSGSLKAEGKVLDKPFSIMFSPENVQSPALLVINADETTITLKSEYVVDMEYL